MLVHVQEFKVAPGQDWLRSPVEWSEIDGSKEWKTLSWLRVKPTWIEANLFPTLGAHSDQSSSLLLLKSSDWKSTIALYPVGTSRIMANLKVVNGTVHANLRREALDREDKAYVVCVRASGWEQNDIVKAAVEEARKLVGGSPKGEPHQHGFWDGVGICSWEAIKSAGERDNRATKKILMDLIPDDPISTFLIDDGWQDIKFDNPSTNSGQRRLSSFSNWSGFGGSLKEVVAAIKDKTGAQVGVWMTLEGYWFGVDPKSDIGKKYECKGFHVGKNGVMGVQDGPLNPGKDEVGDEVMYVPSPHKAKSFWVDWFTELKSKGIDFVKVDNQAAYDSLVGSGSIEAAEAMFQGMLEACVEVFGSIDRVIMCMAHTERMLNGPGGLDFDRPAGELVFRNSDDYNIDYPSGNGHVDFPYWNLYSSILHSHLSFLPDFDMFASTPADHLPSYHAFLRCLSPGPTLVSDLPGDIPDESLKKKVISRDAKGAVKAVKTTTPASALPNRWFWDNVRVGKGDGPALVGGVAIPSAHGALLGAWYCRDSKKGGIAVDKITLRDVEDVLGGPLGDSYVLWKVGLEGGGPAMEIAKAGWQGHLDIELEKNQVEEVIVARIWERDGKKVAVLGMMDKFATLAGIKVSVDGDELKIETTFETDKLTVVAWPETQLKLGRGEETTSEKVELKGESVQLYTIAVKGSESVSSVGDVWETRLQIE